MKRWPNILLNTLQCKSWLFAKEARGWALGDEHPFQNSTAGVAGQAENGSQAILLCTALACLQSIQSRALQDSAELLGLLCQPCSGEE